MPYLQGFSVPNFQGLVEGAGHKHACVVRIPLNCFNAEFVYIPARPTENKNIRAEHKNIYL